MEAVAGGEPASHDPRRLPAGKLRRTALRLLAGRRSICMLPGFLVGRARAQARGPSKAGATKGRSSGGDVTAADFEFHHAGSLGDALGPPESPERSLPRHRRGLRGFLSSIRRHRRGKNASLEKSEALEMSPDPGRPSDREAPHLSVPMGATATGTPPASTRENDTPVPGGGGRASPDEEGLHALGPEEETREEKGCGSDPVMDRRLTGAEPETVEPRGGGTPELPAASPSASTDNLVFGDVSSLKSFDSLTGCGDIIAERDDVSVAGSSASGERASHGGAKRGSCLVTYQGGGEEMATPDEADGEYLDGLWESEGSEVCYLSSGQSLSPSTTPDQPTSSSQVTSSGGNTGSDPLAASEAGLTPTDLLTPQSDRMGSVPNSDEGYYDSTTPGADEEGRECPPKERLPRDSYSGDALYELFDIDDELLSPRVNTREGQALQAHEGEGDVLYALSSAAPESSAMETEEERLGKIQRALRRCELQNLRNASEEWLLYGCDRLYSHDSPRHQGGRSHSSKELRHGAPCASDSANSSPQGTPSPLQDAGMYAEREGSREPPARCGSQSQEDLMVCFSQALVDFTKNSRRYRNSTGSLDRSESGSPFGPSLSALPAIVTFDVVDVENEGECEQPGPAEEEAELASPYEDFDDCYLQQDAFAECDRRTFDARERSLLSSHAWGIASLPRHLGLTRPCPPIPAPLTHNRRSRSLDTDGLELRTVLAPGKKVTPVQHTKDPSETRDLRGMALPRLPDRRLEVSKEAPQRSLKGPPWLAASTGLLAGRPSVRPAYLPLQSTYPDSSEEAGGGRSDPYPCSHPPAGKGRPVGVAQGVPHLRSEQSNAAREVTAKNRQTDIQARVSTATKRNL